MNSAWTCLVLGLVSAAVARPDFRLDQHWEMWKAKYEKNYMNTEEEVYRRTVWEKNLLKINTHNLEASLGRHTYTLAMNRMGDLTKEEARQIYLNLKIPKDLKRTSVPLKARAADLPDSMDWKQKGWVTPVKDQGMCGSCWAFSVAGVMEGHLYNTSGQLVNLSEQQLVDCAGEYGNLGCRGGYMDKAFQYVIAYGLEDEDHYPYEAKDDVCRYNPAYRRATCSEFRYVEKNEAELKAAVATVGPISVGVFAEPLMFYSSGIFSSDDCSGPVDHAVLAVGYGQDGGDFWLVKNSWGVAWGEAGYFRLARNQGNMCSIASFATYCAE